MASGIEIRAGKRTQRDFVLTSRATGAFSGAGYGTVEGVVVDDAGQAVPNPTVIVREVDRGVHGDYLGAFSIDSLSSGVYALVAVAEGYDTSNTVDTDVWEGEVSTVSITLRRTVASAGDLTAPPDMGLLTGIVVDAEKQEPLAGVEVSVVDERIDKAVTDLSGRYVLPAVPEGSVVLRFSHADYEDKLVEGVVCTRGEVTMQDALLSVSGVSQMDRISVRAPAVRSTGAALLRERQDAVSFTDAVGAQEMSRAGASTAADAMRSVTGATVVGGKYVLIRGLPERYTLTMLNACPLPSPDPDRKAVNMDIFPAGMIENITVHKTFTPDLPGDWGGGVVDIRTKPFPEQFTLSIGASVGANAQCEKNELGERECHLSNQDFLTYDGGDLDWLGIDDGSRARPEILTEYSKRDIEALYGVATRNWDSPTILNRLNDPDDLIADTIALINEIANSLDTVMIPYETTAPPDQSYSFSVGNTFTVFDQPLGMRLGLSYSNSNSLSLDDISRSFDNFAVWTDTGSHIVEPFDDFRVTKAKNTVRWGGLFTGAYRLSDQHQVQANYLYTRSATDEVKVVNGLFGYYEHEGYDFRRLHFTERTLSFVQPNGKHRLNVGKQPLDLIWNGSYTSARQQEPNTRDSYHFRRGSGAHAQYQMQPNFGDASHRWRDLVERGGTFDLRLALPFYQWDGDSATAIVGGAWFGKKRNLTEYRYTYDLYNYFQGLGDPSIRPEDLISPSHRGVRQSDTTLTGYARGLRIQASSQADAQWEGRRHFFSGYGFVQLPLVSRLSTTLGLRYEGTDMFGWTTVREFQIDSTKVDTTEHDILPAISFGWKLSDEMSVRAAYGRTMIRPSMRERAPYVEEDFLGGRSYIGNPRLQNSPVDNVDIRWEWYMKPGELLAASAYYKRVHQPIEISFFSGSNDIRKPVNTTNDATIWGLEFEARKQLDMFRWSRHFIVSGNLTLARSRVELDSLSRKLETYFPYEEDHRPFQGQSPIVGNVFLVYDNPDIGLNLNLLYNVFGERLGEITNQNMPWEWERPQHLLDATAQQKLGEHFAVKLKVKNILGSSKKFVHYYVGQTLLVREEKPGRSFSAGLDFSF